MLSKLKARVSSLTYTQKAVYGSFIFLSIYTTSLFAFASTLVPPGSTLDPSGGPGSYAVIPPIVYGGTVTTGHNNEVLYNDGTGLLVSDTGFVRDNGITKQTDISANLYAQGTANDGIITTVSFQADTIGSVGNTISLIFDGIDDAQTVVDAWNLANPTNTVSIISGVGTTVPTAGTITLIGGGSAGINLGNVSTVIGDIQGSGIVLNDTVNNLSAFNVVGNLSPLSGGSNLGTVFGTVDTISGESSYGVFNFNSFNLTATNQSTYSAEIRGTSAHTSIIFNAREINVSDVGGFQWTNTNNGINYIMPDGSHTPALDEVLTVDSIVGNDYYLDFKTFTAGSLIGYTDLFGLNGNTALGDQTAAETIGYSNTWMGVQAARSWTGAGVPSSRNTVIGMDAAPQVTLGTKNVILGYQTLIGASGTVDNSVILGADLQSGAIDVANSVVLGTDVHLIGTSNMIAIGYGLTNVNSDDLRIGNLISGHQDLKNISIGDATGAGNKSVFSVNDNSSQINASVDGSFILTNTTPTGSTIDANALTHDIYIGDVGNVLNKTNFTVLDSIQRIFAQTDAQFDVENSTGKIFLNIDQVNKLYELGDKNNTNSGTFISVNDNIPGITFSYAGGGAGNFYKFPTVDGTSGQVLKTNGSGTMSWVTPGQDSLAATQIGFGDGTNLLTGSSSFVWDDTNGRLGIGTSNPGVDVDIVRTGLVGSAAIGLTQYATGSNPQFYMQRAMGSEASPTAMTSGQTLGDFSWRGYTGSAFTGTRADIGAKVSENWSPTANGTNLVFYTTPNGTTTLTEGMRLTSEGNVGIGVVNPVVRFDVYNTTGKYVAKFFNDGASTTTGGLLVQAGLDDSSAAGPSTLIDFQDGNDDPIGSITFGASATAYNTTSDRRLKENIVDTSLSINLLNQIKIRDFTWIADNEHKLSHGVIAQELYDVYPGAVTKPIDETTGTWMVDYSKLVPLAIKSIQDLDLKLKPFEDLLTVDNTFAGTLRTWLASASNGITSIFSKEIVTNKICVNDENGQTCVSRSQLNSLLGGVNNQGQLNNPPPSPDPVPLVCTPPQILNGDGTACVDPTPDPTSPGDTPPDTIPPPDVAPPPTDPQPDIIPPPDVPPVPDTPPTPDSTQTE